MGAGQSASTPRSPTSSQLDLFILPPPPKKKIRGWDGITDEFSTDIEAKFDLVCPEQVLGNIVATWLHEISNANNWRRCWAEFRSQKNNH